MDDEDDLSYDPAVEEFAEEQGEDEYDKAFDEFGDIDMNFDYDSLSTTVASKPKSPIETHWHPDKHNTPASAAMTNGGSSRIRNPLIPLRINVQSGLLNELDREPGLPMLSELSEKEIEFYRNHWRRGADRAEEKRVEIEDGVWEPTKKATRPKVPKRGGFRGRGRGRGRGKVRKR